MHVEYKQDAEEADVVHLMTKQRKTEVQAVHVEYKTQSEQTSYVE